MEELWEEFGILSSWNKNKMHKLCKMHAINIPKTEHMAILGLAESRINNGPCMKYSIFLWFSKLGDVSVIYFCCCYIAQKVINL